MLNLLAIEHFSRKNARFDFSPVGGGETRIARQTNTYIKIRRCLTRQHADRLRINAVKPSFPVKRIYLAMLGAVITVTEMTAFSR
jgi:hypothetical protein